MRACMQGLRRTRRASRRVSLTEKNEILRRPTSDPNRSLPHRRVTLGPALMSKEPIWDVSGQTCFLRRPTSDPNRSLPHRRTGRKVLRTGLKSRLTLTLLKNEKCFFGGYLIKWIWLEAVYSFNLISFYNLMQNV